MDHGDIIDVYFLCYIHIVMVFCETMSSTDTFKILNIENYYFYVMYCTKYVDFLKLCHLI